MIEQNTKHSAHSNFLNAAKQPIILPERVVVTWTAFGKSPNVLVQSFRSLVKDAIHSNLPVCINASVHSGEKGMSDIQYLEMCISNLDINLIDIHFTRQNDCGKKKGKRYAEADSIDFARKKYIGEDIVYLQMDGDIIVPEGTLITALIYLRYLKCGALTVNNKSIMDHDADGAIEFSNNRLSVLRDIDCSVNVTVLTGRWSLIEGFILENDDAIKTIRHHLIKDPIHGYIRSNMGDDKTMMYLALLAKANPQYINNITVFAFEDVPDVKQRSEKQSKLENISDSFFSTLYWNLGLASNASRYKRNMILHGRNLLRVFTRKDLGTVRWLKLIFQQTGQYTCYAGITSLIVLLLASVPVAIQIYILGTLSVKLIQSLFAATLAGRWTPYMIPHFWLIQSPFKWLEHYISFHLNVQDMKGVDKQDKKNIANIYYVSSLTICFAVLIQLKELFTGIMNQLNFQINYTYFWKMKS